MPFKTTLIYSESLIKKAVLSFWWRTVGVKFLIALALIIFGLASGYRAGNQSWVMGVLVSVLFFGVAIIVALYVVHYKGAIKRFKAMGEPTATLTITSETCTFVSGAGAATLPWSAITEVWQFSDYWLLFYSKAQFSILPLANLSSDIQDFIVQHVNDAGGKICI